MALRDEDPRSSEPPVTPVEEGTRRVLLVGGPCHGHVYIIRDGPGSGALLRYALPVEEIGEWRPAESVLAQAVLYTSMKWADACVDDEPMLLFEAFVTQEVRELDSHRLAGMVMSALLRYMHATHPGDLTITERHRDQAIFGSWGCRP